MSYLVSGYKSGVVALWDMKNYKLVKILNDVHTSEIVNVKIYNVDEDKHIVGILAMELSGPVCKIEIKLKNDG